MAAARRMVLAVLLVGLAVWLPACTNPAPGTPGFPSSSDGPQSWRSADLPVSLAATAVAGQLAPRLTTVGQPSTLLPVYEPTVGSEHVTWDTLVPTGEVLVVTSDPKTYDGSTFSIRPNPSTGMWEFARDRHEIRDAVPVFTSVREISRMLDHAPLEMRLVPTTYGGLDWIVVRAASGEVYASPVQLPRTGWNHSVDAQILHVGQVLPVDSIVHPIVEVARPLW